MWSDAAAAHMNGPPISRPPDPPPPLSDDEVIRLAGEGREGEQFRALHRGKLAGIGKVGVADLVYCTRLATVSPDPDQIVRIWRASARWGARCEGNPTYALQTAAQAVNNVKRRRKARPLEDDNATLAPAPSVPPIGPEMVPAFVPPPPPEPPLGVVPPSPLRPASSIRATEVRWFLKPWIPCGELSFVVGDPGTGKSTFLAWLVAQARAAVVFPGHEESIGAMFRPRLVAHGADLDRVFLLTEPGWTFPGALKRTVNAARQVDADLIIMDPVDSYLDESVSHNDAQGIRSALEALSAVAAQTGAAVVAVRHPGKMAGNVCPGSRAWRAVPRMIVQLVVDGSTPPRRWLRAFKDSLGACPPDRFYDLVGAGAGQPRVFTPGGLVRPAVAETCGLGMDRVELKKLDIAVEMIKALLSDGKQEAGFILNHARSIGIGDRTCYLAAERLGVKKLSEGGGRNCRHFWLPPETWPE